MLTVLMIAEVLLSGAGLLGCCAVGFEEPGHRRSVPGLVLAAGCLAGALMLFTAVAALSLWMPDAI